MASRSAPRGAMIGLLLVALAVAGCGGGGGRERAFIVRSPAWPHEQYQRLTVNVRCDNPRGKSAARQLEIALADKLAQNGAFTVIASDALKDVLTEQDLSQLSDVSDSRTVIPAGKIKAAQALVLGKLVQCDLDTKRFENRRPIYARDQRGRVRVDRLGRPIVVKEEVTPSVRTTARLSGWVRVIDLATGETVFSYTTPPIERESSGRGATPKQSAEELALDAAAELASDLYVNLAPQRVEVKLKSKMLVVARDYYDGEYDEIDAFPPTQEKLVIAVRNLPPECERNRFRLAVSPLKARNLWEEQFVWSSANPVRGIMFELPVARLMESGATEFTAKLYSADEEEPLLYRKFAVTTKEE